MAFSGVRSSWLILARNSDLAWLAASARSRATSESRLARPQRHDQVVLVVAQQQHVARGAVDLARHIGEIEHEQHAERRDAVIYQTALVQRHRTGPAVDGENDDGKRPGCADQRAVAGDGAAESSMISR